MRPGVDRRWKENDPVLAAFARPYRKRLLSEAETLSRRSRGRLGAVDRPRAAATIAIGDAGWGFARNLLLLKENT